MSANFIKRSKRVEEEIHELVFEFRDDPSSAYAFPCDQDGGLIWEQMSDAARENYRKCRDYTFHVHAGEVRTRYNRYTEPAVIECVGCHAHVVLYDSWASSCPTCGREYNGAGQLLAPRSQWGEETGETVSDMEIGMYRDWEDW